MSPDVTCCACGLFLPVPEEGWEVVLLCPCGEAVVLYRLAPVDQWESVRLTKLGRPS